MKTLRLSTQIHKWVGLVVGIQVLFWVAGGVVMSAIPIETVRSEHRVRPPTPTPLALDEVRPLEDVASARGLAVARAELKSTPRGPAWVLTPVEGEPVVVSARTGAAFEALEPGEIAGMAATAYQGPGRPVRTELLPEAPQETGREGPLWRVDFSDRERTTFYLSPVTGEVVSRRSAVWRFYDFFWRLHILDLKEGENFNHPLLVAASLLALGVVVTGFILLGIRLSWDWTMHRARRRRGA